MSQIGSYQIQTISSHIDLEISRLKAQVDLFWPGEWMKYREFGMDDGMAVVELGSGPGHVTQKLLQSLTDASVTAVEIDPLLVAQSSRQLEAYVSAGSCKIVEGSIMETGLPDNTFDFAITRLVLEHLPDPLGAVKEIYRILKPGGRAMFIDNDFDMHVMTYPRVPELRELYDAYCRSRSDEGGNPRIGRELPGLLKRGGLENIRFEILAAHSDIMGTELFARSEGIGIPAKLVRDGYLSSKVLGQLSLHWRDMLRHENCTIIRQLYMAAGEKLCAEGGTV